MNTREHAGETLPEPVERLSRTVAEITAKNEPGPIALAISGGLDSMVLLAAAARLTQDASDWLVIHVDHGLRRASGDDADFVKAEAAAFGIPCEIVCAEVEGGSGSLEERARRARYAALFRAIERAGSRHVLTAQHAGDQAETVLMSHMRGSDLLGLAGMPAERFLVSGQRAKVHRPFLEVSRVTLEQFARKNSLDWREDRSNRDLTHRRNLVRNLMLPLMDESDGIHERLAALGRGVRDTNRRIMRLAIALEKTLETKHERGAGSDRATLPMEPLLTVPPEVSFHLLERQLERLGAPPGSLTPKHFARIITAEAAEVAELRRNLHAHISSSGSGLMLELVLRRESDVVEADGTSTFLRAGDRVHVDGVGVIEVDQFTEAAPRHAHDEVWVPEAVIDGELELRPPVEGEKMEPFGLGGTKLVSDLLSEAKVPVEDRWSRPVVADAKGVLWIPDVRASERCRIIGTKGSFLRVRLVKE